jgi:hypothetical protein
MPGSSPTPGNSPAPGQSPTPGSSPAPGGNGTTPGGNGTAVPPSAGNGTAVPPSAGNGTTPGSQGSKKICFKKANNYPYQLCDSMVCNFASECQAGSL